MLLGYPEAGSKDLGLMWFSLRSAGGCGDE